MELTRYERRGIVARAVTVGVVVSIAGFLLDALLHHLSLTWLRERLVGNVIEGIVLTGVVAVVIRTGDQRVHRRFVEIGYLNHHIRNSLTIIQFSEQVSEREKRYAMIHEACTRIQRSLEKVSRHEDCCIDDNNPQQP